MSPADGRGAVARLNPVAKFAAALLIALPLVVTVDAREGDPEATAAVL